MKKWFIWATLFYLHALFLIFQGLDRIGSYSMDEIGRDNKYAYVGNDADNFIINSNFLTGYFALASAFIIGGTLLLVTGSILKEMRKSKQTQVGVLDENKG